VSMGKIGKFATRGIVIQELLGRQPKIAIVDVLLSHVSKSRLTNKSAALAPVLEPHGKSFFGIVRSRSINRKSIFYGVSTN